VGGTGGAVSKATLRLWVVDKSSNGPALYATTTGWSEDGLTWNSRPARMSGVLGDLGSVSSGAWVEYDVTAVVTGDGSYGFGLIPTSSDGFDVYAREGVYKPQLVVTTGSTPVPSSGGTSSTPVPSPDTTAPTTPGNLTASGQAATSVTLGWQASTDGVGVAGYRVFRDGTAVGTTQATSYTVSGLTCGTGYAFAVEAYDAAGNASPRASLQAQTGACSDATAPAVSISSPASGTAYTSAQTVTIQASASDNVGVTKVEFYDGATLRGTDTSTPFTYGWAITSADNGTHAWTAKAYDAAGNRSARWRKASETGGSEAPAGAGGLLPWPKVERQGIFRYTP